MDFLNSISIPQSPEHFNVLILIGGMVSVILYPYLGFLLGSSVLSYRLNRKGSEDGDRQLVEFARLLIETPLKTMMVPAFLALLPAFSLMFVFAQMMQSTDAISAGLAGYGFLALLAGVAALVVYKYTFRLRGILREFQGLLHGNVHGAAGTGDIERYADENAHTHFVAGRSGIILVALAAFLIVSSVSVTMNPSAWSDVSGVFDLLLSADVWVKILQFAVIAVGVTGIGILYFIFTVAEGKSSFDAEHQGRIRRLAFRMIVGSFLVQPVFLVIAIVLLPSEALSGLLFGFFGLSLALLFLAAQFLYAYFREARPQYVKSAVYSLFASLLFLSVNDQVAIHSATNNHAAYLAYRYDIATEELKTRLGVAVAAMTGEDIYNGRCSACHLFDEKKIGPAYKDVIPTFGGDKAKIIAFVLNPVKVNPAFPPMPNQGLKPAEADSIVSYILRRLGTSKTAPATEQKAAPKK